MSPFARLRGWLSAAAVIALLPCCASRLVVGQQFPTDHRKELRKGETSKEQVRSWFGEPGSVEKSSLPGCVEQWYSHYSITDDWKQGTVSKTFTASFDEKGLLCAAYYTCTGRCVGADTVAGGEEAKGEVSIFDPLLRPSRKFDTSRIRDLVLRKQGRAEVSVNNVAYPSVIGVAPLTCEGGTHNMSRFDPDLPSRFDHSSAASCVL